MSNTISNIINIEAFRLKLKAKRMEALGKLSDAEVEQLAMAGLADSTGEFCDKWIGKVDSLEAEIKAALRKLDADLLEDLEKENTLSLEEAGEILEFDCDLIADAIGKEVREDHQTSNPYTAVYKRLKETTNDDQD